MVASNRSQVFLGESIERMQELQSAVDATLESHRMRQCFAARHNYTRCMSWWRNSVLHYRTVAIYRVVENSRQSYAEISSIININVHIHSIAFSGVKHPTLPPLSKNFLSSATKRGTHQALTSSFFSASY